MTPRTTDFFYSRYGWLTLCLFTLAVALLVVPTQAVKSADQGPAVQSHPYQTFDVEQTTKLNELYGRWQSGEKFSEEEGLILQRWGMGLPLSELEGRVVISRVLFERYSGHALTSEAAELLAEFEGYRRVAGQFVEDERVRMKQERAARESASTGRQGPTVVPESDEQEIPRDVDPVQSLQRNHSA